MIPITFIIASLIVLGCAEPIPRSTFVLETRPSVPAGFAHSGPAAADTTIELRIQLTQSNLAGLEQELYAVSTPSSARYGQHLSKEQVEEYVKPSSETVTLVNEWLSGEGISAQTVSPAGDWLAISLPVSRANELLDTEFNVYTYEESGKQSIRTLSYSIPSNLQGHIDLVHPTVAFPVKLYGGPLKTAPAPKLPKSKPPANLTSRTVPSICSSYILPDCLQALYGIPTTGATQSSNGLGVSGFIQEYANEYDLEIFLYNFRTDIPYTTSFSLQTIDGGSNPQGSGQGGLEANLDIQYTVGIATYVPVTFISVGSDNTDGIDGFLDEINTLLAESNPPHVLTTSYGFNENEIPTSLANSVCNAYMQLGARGTSILFASGDGGVSGFQPVAGCTDFGPTFPSGCPYVTAVGATGGVPETSASFSSGGFSNIFAQPSYQSSAVAGYLNSIGSEYSGLFNRAGRAYPDISAQGVNVEIVLNVEGELVYGTSCSSPIFASVIALLNDRLISANKSPLGFLNPFIYSTGASALNDITTGDNPGCGTNGFPAIAGWDPVTGLGTPNWGALLTAVGL